MKNLTKTFLPIWVLLLLELNNAYAAYTYTWTGNVSGVWETPGNWTRTGTGGTSVNYPGENASISDIVQIGVGCHLQVSRFCQPRLG